MTLQLFSLYVWGWQLAAQAKDRGIPQDVIDLAFMAMGGFGKL